MSFHAITQLVKYAVTTESKVIEELRTIPYRDRAKDQRLKDLVNDIKISLQKGSVIERMASIGWIDTECEQLFSDILENFPQLKKEYEEQLQTYGKISQFSNDNFEEYERAIQEERKNF